MLTHFLARPDYGRGSRWLPLDMEYDSNPVSMPSVHCPACGQTWSILDRVPWLNVPNDSKVWRSLSVRGPVSPEEFKELCDEVKAYFGLPADFRLSPGTTLGRAHVAFRRTSNLPDFIWDAFPILLVSPKVQQVLNRSGLTGYTSLPISAVVPAGEEEGEATSFEELIITGSAGKPIIGEEFKVKFECGTCGFTRRGRLTYLCSDPTAWDGQDFGQFNGPPRHRLLSDKAVSLFQRERFTNVDLRPLGPI